MGQRGVGGHCREARRLGPGGRARTVREALAAAQEAPVPRKRGRRQLQKQWWAGVVGGAWGVGLGESEGREASKPGQGCRVGAQRKWGRTENRVSFPFSRGRGRGESVHLSVRMCVRVRGRLGVCARDCGRV